MAGHYKHRQPLAVLPHSPPAAPWWRGSPLGRRGGTGSRQRTSSGAPRAPAAPGPAPTPSRLREGRWAAERAYVHGLQAAALLKSSSGPAPSVRRGVHNESVFTLRQQQHPPMDQSVKGAASCCPCTSVSCLRTVARRARPSASASARPAAAAATPRSRRDRRVGSRLASSGWAAEEGGWGGGWQACVGS